MKRVLSIVLALAMIVSMFAGLQITSSALEPTGKCGGNVYWSFDSSTGTLTISGEGEMYNYNFYDSTSPFRNNYNINEVIIETGVTRIGDNAFYGCSYLKDLVIPGYIDIGSDAFKNTGIYKDSTNWEDNVLYYNNYLICAENAQGLIRVKSGTEIIATGAFAYNKELSRVIIPDSVKIIGKNAFRGCNGLKKINIPDSIESIGDFAFDNCSSLTSLTIPNGISFINNYVFSRCSSLSEVVIPDGVTGIGYDSFYGCSSLTEIHIPSSITAIGSNAFKNCSALNRVYIQSVESFMNINYADEYSNPFYYGADLYLNGEIVSKLIILEGTYGIPSYAFSGCTSITEIEIPEEVVTIGNFAFFNCSNLQQVFIPEYAKNIGTAAFCGSESLESIVVHPDNRFFSSINNALIDTRTNELLLGCKNTGDLPDTLTNINSYAFAGSTGLESIDLPDSISYIGEHAFENCKNLKSIDLPSGIEKINDYTFNNCKDLKSINIEDNITSTGRFAFANCTSLESIIIGKNTSVDSSVFSGCTNLSSIEVSEENPYIDSRDNCNAIIYNQYSYNTLILGCKNTIIPNTVDTIGDEAFCGCEGLTKITIPESVRTIRNKAFYGCKGLTEITIPEGVEEIGTSYDADGAFEKCSNLVSIILPVSIISVEQNSFKDSGLKYIFYSGTENQFSNICYHEYYNDWAPASVGDSDGQFVDIGDETRTQTWGNNPFDTQAIVHYNATDHSWDDGVITTESTCAKNGVKTFTCSVCGDTYTQSLPLIDHTPAEAVKENEVPATCTKAGSYDEVVYCSVCEAELSRETKTIPPIGFHTPAEAVIENEVPATCTHKGTYDEVVYCSFCGEELSRELKQIEKIEHNYLSTVTAPSCTEQGYTTHTCEDCGYSYVDSFTSFAEHTPVIDEAVAPTCTKSGLTQGSHCSVCGKVITEQTIVPASEHNYTSQTVEPTCTHAGYTTYTCEDCGYSYIGDFTERADHTYKDTVVEPTTESQGYTVHTCITCGYSYVDSITDILPSEMHYIIPSLEEINATLTIKSNENEYSVTSANGVFELDNIKGDVYRVYASQKNSLTVSIGEYDTKSGEVINSEDVVIPVGNVNGDDVIDLSDVSLLLASDNYGKQNADLDLTGDNQITVEDISVVLQSQNFGAQSSPII